MNTADMRKADNLNSIADEIRISAKGLQDAGFFQAADEQLAAFHGMTPDERCERWAQMDNIERQQFAWAVVRKKNGLTWAAAPDVDAILLQVETLTLRFTPLSPSDQATLGALEDTRDRAVTAEWNASLRGDADEVRFFARERAASNRARAMFLAGVRAEQVADGSWRVPSEESNLIYTVTREGKCNCTAGRNERLCKHVALVSATETGLDNLSAFDDYDPEPEYVEAAASALWGRVAAARAQKLLEVA